MNDLTVSLDAHDSRPLYEQLYDYLKKEIQSGRLACRTKLPSTRKFAAYLDVSRSTVIYAYEQLMSEGYIDSRPGGGYFVSSLDGLYRLPGVRKTAVPAPEAQEETYEYDFSPSGVAPDSSLQNTWRRISRKLLSEENPDFFRLGPPEGEEELRATIAAYIYQARGVRCVPQQIIIGAGSDYLLMLLDALLGKETIYALENPTYKKAYHILETLGHEIKAVAVDQNGMDVPALEASGASAAYVMPSHQFPLGIVMPAGRRRQLLNWAAEKENRYIIEDDYDSEFRYKGRPIPALQGMDENDRVIYMGTFSKSIAPAIRISFLVLPKTLLECYRRKGRRFSSTVPRMEQRILAEFIRGGYYERHLNRMRAVYKSRHDALLECLKGFETILTVSGEYAGTHLLVKLRCEKEQRAVALAKKAGVRVYALSDYYIGQAGKPDDTLLLGYAGIDEEGIRGAAERMRAFLVNPGDAEKPLT